MTLPSYSLEVAFGIDPRSDPASGDWVDITRYMKASSVQRGKNTELDAFEAGSMTLELDDPDRRFEPEYRESPYYPDVVPDTHIRLRATYSAVIYDVWRGYVNTWKPRWELPGAVSVNCTDAFKYFGTRKLLSPYLEQVLEDSPVAYWRLDEAAGPVAIDSSGNGNTGQYVGLPSFGSGVVNFPTDSDYLLTPVRITGTTFSIEFWMRHATVSGADNFSVVSQAASGAGTAVVIWMEEAGADAGKIMFFFSNPFALPETSMRLDDDVWHHIVATYDGINQRLYVDGVLDATNAVVTNVPTDHYLQIATSDLINGWAGDLDEIAIYSSVLSLARVQAHYAARDEWEDDLSGERITRLLDQIDWPSALRTIDTGNTSLQTAGDLGHQTALEHMQLVEASEFGALYMTKDGKVRWREREAIDLPPFTQSQVTIGRGTGELPYVLIEPDLDDNLIRNEVKLSREGGSEHIVREENRYFYRTFSRSGLQNQDDAELADLAQLILDKYKVPYTTAEVTLNPRADDALWPQVFGRELEDAVVVSRIPPGPSFEPFVWDQSEWDETTLWSSADPRFMRILAINHDVRQGFSWKTTWKLSPI